MKTKKPKMSNATPLVATLRKLGQLLKRLEEAYDDWQKAEAKERAPPRCEVTQACSQRQRNRPRRGDAPGKRTPRRPSAHNSL